MSLTPAEIVSLLGTTTPSLSARIGSISRHWKSAGHDIEGRFFYVRFRDSAPTVDDLIDIAHARMVNFCMPRTRIKEAKAEMMANPDRIDCWVDLVTEARDLFIKTYEKSGRSGELGEILLYMLVESVLKAPIVACKMYLKTSLQMPVHGVDGIHMGFEGDNLIMYWGESKLHKDKSSALTDIAESISGFTKDRDKYKREVRIIKSNLNIDDLNSEAINALKSYFDPYKEESNNLIDCYACLAGFDSSLYDIVSNVKHDACEKMFCSEYENKIQQLCDLISNKTEEYGLGSFKFSYFLLPFPSVDAARKKFQSKLWGRS
ncbi:hypothetical protein DWUX_2189 [Desulfovibrio diazotrophicus]|jgi:hypothetical protein|nr:hypothetical protein DWUX_2189 [Desulfovibrio diazotrophicus]